MRGEICPVSGSKLVEPYVISNSKLAWEIKQWLLSVCDYADDLEYDKATNTVKGNSSLRDFGIPVVKKDKKQQHRDGGKSKSSSKSSKNRSSGDAPRSPVPPSSSRPGSSRGGGGGMVPNSAPAAGATQKKGAFKLRSPKFLRNLLNLPDPQGVDLDLDDSEVSTSHGLEESAKPVSSSRKLKKSEIDDATAYELVKAAN
jgi:hypothetical protein